MHTCLHIKHENLSLKTPVMKDHPPMIDALIKTRLRPWQKHTKIYDPSLSNPSIKCWKIARCCSVEHRIGVTPTIQRMMNVVALSLVASHNSMTLYHPVYLLLNMFFLPHPMNRGVLCHHPLPR